MATGGSETPLETGELVWSVPRRTLDLNKPKKALHIGRVQKYNPPRRERRYGKYWMTATATRGHWLPD